jgi:hypothetical protein
MSRLNFNVYNSSVVYLCDRRILRFPISLRTYTTI